MMVSDNDESQNLQSSRVDGTTGSPHSSSNVMRRNRHTNLELVVAMATIVGVVITCVVEFTSRTDTQPVEIRLAVPNSCGLIPTAEPGWEPTLSSSQE
jgi:hypothetical protein